MTKETLLQLTTGDLVKHTSGEVYMIAVISPNLPCVVTIDDLFPLEKWVLFQSRLVVTREQLQLMKEYHEKVKQNAVKDHISKRIAVISGTHTNI